MIPPDPNNTLETLASFPIPINAGATPSPNGRTVEACAKIPVFWGGSGASMWPTSLDRIAKLLGILQTLVDPLNPTQEQELGSSLNIMLPNSVRHEIALAIRYLAYYENRDELLQQAFADLMSRTK